MANLKSLVTTGGTTQQIPSGDTLVVGAGIKASSTALALSTSDGTGTITIGGASNTISLPGTVNTTGVTTFTNNATFQGNVTFGDGTGTDTVSYNAATRVASNMAFQLSAATPNSGTLVIGGSTFLLQSNTTPSVTISYDGSIPFPGLVVDTNTTTQFTARYGAGTVASSVTSFLTAPAFSSASLSVDGGTLPASGSYSPSPNPLSGGSAAAAQYRVNNLQDPSAAQDAATKNYVDTQSVASFSAGSTGFTPSTATKGAVTLAGTLNIANGGTGQTSKTAAFDALAPTTTAGDTIYYNGTDNIRLGIGSANTVLRSNGSAPAWGSVALTTDVSGTLPVGNGGTGQTTYTDGQLLIGNTTGNTLTKATLTAGSGVSITNGNGSITIAATGSGGTVTSVDVSGGTTGLTTSGGPITGSGTITLAGTLDVDNGGTGQTSYVDGELLIGNSTGNTLSKATLTAGSGVSITNGNGSITIAATGAAAPVIDLTTTGLTQGDVAYVTSTNDTAGAADATSTATGPRAVGFVSTVGGAGTGKVQVGNVYAGANFISSLTLVSGQPVYVSKTAGKLTNDVSAFTTGNVVAEVGIITKVTTAGGGAAAADVLWQPKAIVVL